MFFDRFLDAAPSTVAIYRPVDSFEVPPLSPGDIAIVQMPTLKFKEQLPPSCPPPGAGPQAFEGVWRFVKTDKITDKDFSSHYALGKAMPAIGVTACQWASCSLFVDKKSALKKLPNPRKRYGFIARVKITTECGVSILKKPHIDFWRFDTFAPQVLAIEKL